jgi:hypothetical protein
VVDEYRLDDLGWYQFERLCVALLKARHSAELEAWGGSRDIGRDAYCGGSLNYPNPGVLEEGPFVFQVKFVAGANAAGADPARALTKAVKAECELIKERLAKRLWLEPRYYTFLTNVSFSPKLRDETRRLIRTVLPRAQIIATGGREISAILDNEPRVRMAYPQVLGLRDLRGLLEAVVNADVRTRSTLSLSATAELAPVFVPTAPYWQAVRLLRQHGFVVLAGPPEMGKTATARMIALARHSADWEAIDCQHPDDFFKTLNPDTPQVFVVDDAFGSTEYRPELAMDWAATLDRIVDATNPNHWVIWTSRPGPLHEALERLHLQGSARNFPAPSQLQVNASDLPVADKAQILYRHVKARTSDPRARELVRSCAGKIVHNRHFTPLRIDRLVRDQLPVILRQPRSVQRWQLERAIERGLEEPTREMTISFGALAKEQRALLVSMLNFSRPRVELSELELCLTEFLGEAPDNSVASIAGLIEDHFVRIREH